MSGCGERALVTGASSGIGRAFAVALARRGARIVLVARDGERLRALAAELPGGPHEVLVADLSKAAGCALVGERLKLGEEPVDTLVNGAGAGVDLPFPDSELASEEAQLELNVTATMRLSWAAARAMRARGGGRVVNVGSTAAIWSVGTYAGAKAWVLKASAGLAAEVAEDGVQVLCVIPGFTRTEFHRRSRIDSSGVPGWLWLDPAAIAEESLRALERGRTGNFVPSRRYRLMLALLGPLPDAWRVRALRRIVTLQPAGEER